MCEKKNALGTGLMTITSLTLQLGMCNLLTETDKTMHEMSAVTTMATKPALEVAADKCGTRQCFTKGKQKCQKHVGWARNIYNRRVGSTRSTRNICPAAFPQWSVSAFLTLQEAAANTSLSGTSSNVTKLIFLAVFFATVVVLEVIRFWNNSDPQ